MKLLQCSWPVCGKSQFLHFLFPEPCHPHNFNKVQHFFFCTFSWIHLKSRQNSVLNDSNLQLCKQRETISLLDMFKKSESLLHPPPWRQCLYQWLSQMPFKWRACWEKPLLWKKISSPSNVIESSLFFEVCKAEFPKSHQIWRCRRGWDRRCFSLGMDWGWHPARAFLMPRCWRIKAGHHVRFTSPLLGTQVNSGWVFSTSCLSSFSIISGHPVVLASSRQCLR